MSAEPLLQRFHSLGHVLSAEPAQLAEFGIEASDVTLLRLVRDIACRLLLGAVQSRPTLGNWQALLDYCQAAMSYEQIEQFRILFLDRKNHLIADEVQQHGTVEPYAGIPTRGRQAGAPSQCLGGDPGPQSPLRRSGTVERRHRHDAQAERGAATRSRSRCTTTW